MSFLPWRVSFMVTLITAVLFAEPGLSFSYFEEALARCPIDGKKITYKKVKNEIYFSLMLDGKPYGALISPEPVAKCPEDGFIVYKNAFTEKEMIVLKKYVMSQEYAKLQKAETPYWLINKLQEKLNAPAEKRIPLMQAATWEAHDMIDYEKYCLYAAETIKLIDSIDGHSAELLFLKGELQRRTGNFEEALKTFSALKDSPESGFSINKIDQEIALISDGIISSERAE